jgi:hypothetical protein
MEINESIIVYATRYALGRITYAVSDVCRYIQYYIKELSENCIDILIRDIEDDIKYWNDMGRTCGMECDEKQWRELLELLKEEREIR